MTIRPTWSTFACILTSACAATGTSGPPEVPDPIRVPDGAAYQFEALAAGVQVYECARLPDATFQWVFKEPEAALANREGRTIGWHFAGPVWTLSDGGTVTGTVMARADAPSPGAIPWLLLSVKERVGTGALAEIRFIQRIGTSGGIAPAGGCGEGAIGSRARVPYSAVYAFYR